MSGHAVPEGRRTVTIVGAYTLHLYCAIGTCAAFAEVVGETFGECAKAARDRGWKVYAAKDVALCPEHRTESP